MLTDTNQDGEWAYTYDADSQLTHAVFTPNSSDPDGLTSQNLQYVYDAAGNRISQTVNGVTTTYVANNVNEYTSSTTNGVTTTYQYDNDGNLISQTTGGSTTTYSYDELDELTGVNGPGQTASYTYDPLGNRNSQTVNGTTTQFLIDPFGLGDVASTYSGSGSLIAHYTYGFGLTSQVSASGKCGVLRLQPDRQHDRHHRRGGQLRQQVQLPAVRADDDHHGDTGEPVHVRRPVRGDAGWLQPVQHAGAGVCGRMSASFSPTIRWGWRAGTPTFAYTWRIARSIPWTLLV